MGRKRDSKFDNAYAFYLAGMSLAQVAKEIDSTRQAVFKAFKKRGLVLRGKNFRPFQDYDGKRFTLRNNGYYSLTTDDRSYMHRYVWRKENGPIPKGHDIHHINEDRSDNRIENLECIRKDLHTKKHGFKNNQHTIKKSSGRQQL